MSNKERHAGIDPALNSSAAIVLDGAGHSQEYVLIKPREKWQHPDKIVFIADRLRAFLAGHPELDTVTIEKPFFGPNKLTAQFCMGVWGAMLVEIKKANPKLLIEVHPNHLKKFVTNKFTAQKDQMRLQVYKKWAFEHNSMDVVDAYACAQWGICHLHPKKFGSREASVVADYMRMKNAAFLTGDE